MLQPSPESTSRVGSRDALIVRLGIGAPSLDSPIKIFSPPFSEGGDFDSISDERRLWLFLQSEGVHASIDKSLGCVGLTRGFLFRTYMNPAETWPSAHELLDTLDDHEIVQLVIRAFMR